MINFIQVDDRIIHSQIITRWSREYPCDGTIAVSNRAATTPVLEQSFVASANKRVFVWTEERFLEKAQVVLNNNKRYSLITKNPADMKEPLVNNKFVPGGIKCVVIGPCNDRPDAAKLRQSQSITQEEVEAYEAMTDAGYDVFFALLEETTIDSWPEFRSKFGY